METQSFSDDVRRILGLLWHWAWLIVAAAVLAGVAAYIFSARTTPVYQASTRLLVNEAPATKNTDYASILTSERLARTYSELLTTEPVLEEVIERLDLDHSVGNLKRDVDVQLVRDTQLIDLLVQDTSRTRAALIANTIVTVFSEQNQALQASRFATSKESLSTQLEEVDQEIKRANETLTNLGDGENDKAERDRLEATLAQYRQTYASLLQSFEQVRLSEASSISNVVQVEPATLPIRPIRPRTLTNVLLALVVGLMLAVGVIFLIEALDDTLTPDAVSRELGLPVLGVIARHQQVDAHPVVSDQPRSPVSEAFRSLRTNIQFASVDNPLHTLLVTSPSPEDGKSTVTVNLATSIAQSGHKVAVLEADLRKPQVHKKLGLHNREGITSAFVQPDAYLDGTVQKTEVPNLYALTSGDLPPNPSELLGSEKMSEIMNQLREQVDVILIDTPPVMAVTDAAALSPNVDGVLLVVKPSITKLAACKQAIEQLQRVGANILGVVLNDVDMNRSSYKYGYYRGYYYTYHRYYGNGNNGTTGKGK